jgi:hypothetical protein
VVAYYAKYNMYCVVRRVGPQFWEMKIPGVGFEDMDEPDSWEDFTQDHI